MAALILLGWAAVCVGGALVLAVFATGDVYFIAPAISAVVAGILLLAVDRIISLLSDIRDALQVKPAREVEPGLVADQLGSDHASFKEPEITVAELDAKLAKIRARS